MRSDAANHYLRQRIETATPAQLIGMLYDAGTGAIRSALDALGAGNRAEACPLFIRAQDVVLELRCSLNPDAGEMAARLDAIYAYVYQRLIDANIKAHAPSGEEALVLLGQLQEAWSEACLGRQPATAGT